MECGVLGIRGAFLLYWVNVSSNRVAGTSKCFNSPQNALADFDEIAWHSQILRIAGCNSRWPSKPTEAARSCAAQSEHTCVTRAPEYRITWSAVAAILEAT